MSESNEEPKPGPATPPPAERDSAGHTRLLRTSLGSGLLAQQPTPGADETVAVIKVCPQCGSEYETADRFCPKDGSPLRPKAGGDPLVGRIIADRYLVLARLGEGGMGRVYLAEHVKMNRQCAIKVMNPSLLNDHESATRFAREASNAASILHPNVAAVFDYGEWERVIYLVMEYVDGESLSAILSREGSIAPRRAVDLARQVADGLSAAHELGIVHRDLKPDNVIVARTRAGRETAKVVDFGIAKAVSEMPQDALTKSGLVIGTPEYMSPEQLIGDPVDARADIYALGCILYQMLTGSPAFKADSREQMIRRRLHEPPPHVRDVMPELPRRLDTVLVHMLARSPGDRLATAAAARDALDPALVLEGLATPPHNSTAASPTPTVLRAVEHDPTLQPTVPLPRQRTSVARIAAGVVAGGVVLVAGLALWSNRSPEVKQPAPERDGSVASVRAASPVLPRTDTAPKPPATRVGTPPGTKAGARTQATTPPPTSAPGERAIASVSGDEQAVRLPLDRFAAAVGRGEPSVIEAFPGIPPSVLASFKRVYARADNVHALPLYGRATIAGTTAEVPVSLRLNYLYREGKQPGTETLRYRAVLTRRGDRWEITRLDEVRS